MDVLTFYVFLQAVYLESTKRQTVDYIPYIQYTFYSRLHTAYQTGVHKLISVFISWWRNQMETFSVLLGICAGNSPVPGEFPAQSPVTRSFDVFFDLRPNKRLSKHWWGFWFETLSCPLWRHCNGK